MGKRLALLAIRFLVSANLLYAAIFLKFAGVPGSVALFTQMSQAVHGLVSQPVFRLGSGAFETVVAILLLIPKTARLAAGLTVKWMTAVILSHIFVLGYGWFFVDALTVMVLAVVYLLLTRRRSHWGEPESVGLPWKRAKTSAAKLEAEPQDPDNSAPAEVHIVDGGHFSLDAAANEIAARVCEYLPSKAACSNFSARSMALASPGRVSIRSLREGQQSRSHVQP